MLSTAVWFLGVYSTPSINTLSPFGLGIVARYTLAVPFVGVTAALPLPPPILFASVPATALTEPPFMIILEAVAFSPPPIPAPFVPPTAVTSVFSRVITEPSAYLPPQFSRCK